MGTAYTVQTDVFQGPLELLLDLVEKRKLFICDVALATVADDYLAYVKRFEHYPTADAASFLFVASTLVLIKSKALLPTLTLSEEEEGNIEDLERRLHIYKVMRDLSQHVRTQFGDKMLFARNPSRNIEVVFAPHKRITPQELSERMTELLERLPKKQHAPEAVVAKVVSLEEMIDSLIDRVQQGLTTRFSEFSKNGKGTHKEKKLHAIVGFLAMLELVKQETITVKQDSMFDDITIEHQQHQHQS